MDRDTEEALTLLWSALNYYLDQEEEESFRMSSFLATARTTDEAEATAVTVSRAGRSALDADKLDKLRQNATLPLATKFISPDNEDQLTDVYSIMIRIKEFENRLKRFDMRSVFTVVVPDADKPGTVLMTKDLLTDYANITVDEVRTSVKFYRYWGLQPDFQNIQWTQDLLTNSCESSLDQKVIEQSLAIPTDEMGGPTYFLLMINIITTMTEEGARALTQLIKNMKINEIVGENVAKAVSHLRGAISRLTMVNHLPHDIVHQLTDIFQTSSVEKFNRVFVLMHDTMLLGRYYSPTAEEILNPAETQYKYLCGTNEWTGAGTTGTSAFQAQSRAPITCLNCNGAGHYAHDCPHPSRGGGRGGRGGRRGGRGGRGGGGGRHNAAERPNNPKRIPPDDGESHERMFDNVQHYWCGQCKMWTDSHGTKNHVKGFKQMQKAANVAPVAPANNSVNSATQRDANKQNFLAQINESLARSGLRN